ncbi:hypothetical protein J2S78_001545 [Salibacterium salarium]|nr:hypothetical protein [Salibacterium salarium]
MNKIISLTIVNDTDSMFNILKGKIMNLWKADTQSNYSS